MATFFGEVLPIHSRAVDDNEDENAESPSVYFDLDQRYQDVASLPAYDLVCVATGIAPSIFVQCYLLPDSHQVLGTIRLNPTKQQDCPQRRLGTGLQPSHRRLGQADSLSGPRASLRCASRHCRPSDYKSKGRPEFPLLRQLRTFGSARNGTEEAIPDLETPNTVSGMCAAVLTECEVGDMPGTLFVLYTDTPEVDSTVVRAARTDSEVELPASPESAARQLQERAVEANSGRQD
ncbi:hypothetical protein HPB51_006890 [Rhipicephalus microplus]|uniref:Proteasome assembly chaperone 1 n=1 Tax=Rhipicephalus microplus TaxID=6941 RepID=A0A9J6E831_RHIMP|nr:hypothetical protein HPB51_006890 [Rhipicephalus microplus]